MSTEDLLTTDDRLDAIALVRANLNKDPGALRVLLDHASQGMYLAVVELTTALTHAVSDGHPQQYLSELAESVRSTENR